MTRGFGPRSWRRREVSVKKMLCRTLRWPALANPLHNQKLSPPFDLNQVLWVIDPSSKPYRKRKLHNLRQICSEMYKSRKRMGYSKPLISMIIQTIFRIHHITWLNRDIEHTFQWKTSISSTWKADTPSNHLVTWKSRGLLKIWIKLSIEGLCRPTLHISRMIVVQLMLSMLSLIWATHCTRNPCNANSAQVKKFVRDKTTSNTISNNLAERRNLRTSSTKGGSLMTLTASRS